MNPIRFVTVVPAHNEEELLAKCVTGLLAARDHSGLPVTIVVVLDSCTDRSSEVVPPGVRVIRVSHRNVGAARAAGFMPYRGEIDSNLWFTTTDADSVVDLDWYDKIAAHAPMADLIAGVVHVPSWTYHVGATAALYERLYRGSELPGSHGHIHGASLAVRARSYWNVGGFEERSVHEDVDLVRRVSDAGCRVAWASDVRVSTSDRIHARVRGGFADHLLDVAELNTGT